MAMFMRGDVWIQVVIFMVASVGQLVILFRTRPYKQAKQNRLS